MLKKILALAAVLPLGFGALAQDYTNDFQNPPQEARIRVWWHWMDSNISKEGIKADLDWMKATGVGGFQQFDAGGTMMGGGQSIVTRLPYMQEEWKDAFRYAIRYADELGMEVAIASAPGWSSTGGPWVKPENAMKKLTWRTLEVTGNPKAKKPQVITLPEPFTTVGKFQNAGASGGLSTAPADVAPWYKDVAVVAVRIPDAEKTLAQLGASVTSSGGDFTVSQLTDGDLANGAELLTNPSGTHAWIQYTFPEEVTVKALTLVGGPVRGQWASESPSYNNILQCSQDGAKWEDVCRIPSGSVAQQTADIPVTSARFFRLCVANPVADRTYAAYGYNMPAPKGTAIHEFVLHTVTKVNHAEEKAGFAAPHDLLDNPTPETDAPVLETIDLTARCSDGVLTWNVPEGNWRIYRFGASLTGKQNHPAPPEATGLEVDKLDETAWMDYFRQYMDMYKEAAGGMVGQHGIQYILTDSYEAEQMTWTPEIAAQFTKRRGYNPVPWYPALTGEIIQSAEKTEQFLFDWRETLGELFAANYDRINQIAKEYGMKGRYTESHENGRVYIGDGMDLKMTAAVPMSAFWMPGTGGGSALVMAQADIRESASTAHVYGQNIAAAESFTAAGLSGNAWSYYPGNLKTMADIALYSGVTRFVIHESAHQPSDAHKPGLGLMIFGQWFNRHDTWAPYARYWADYLARSCYMLQRGHYVADVLWYYGEDTNIAGIYGLELPEVPEQYSYDFINPYGLLNVVYVKDGKLVTPSGMQYKVLVLGDHCQVMSIEVLRKLDQLAREGAVIVGRKPVKPAGMTDCQAEFDRLVADIWNAGRANVHTTQLSRLLAETVEPDFQYSWPSQIRFVHRTDGGKEIYWVRNFSEETACPKIVCRDGKGVCTVLNPETGKELQGVYKDGVLKLEAGQALFLVFDRNGAAKPEYIAPKTTGALALDGAWNVSFEGLGAPQGSRTFATLASYTESEEEAVKYFSGIATYTNTFTLGKKEKADGLRIDLGSVGQMADVFINGEHVDFLWKAPYKVDWTGTLKPGRNTIEVRVVNTWPNRLIGDAQPGAEKLTYTTMPFYRADSPLTPSGLMGPVVLEKLTR